MTTRSQREAWGRKLKGIRSQMRTREPVKLTKVNDAMVRVSDLHGQGSQYVRRELLPKRASNTLKSESVAFAIGLLNENGRWTSFKDAR